MANDITLFIVLLIRVSARAGGTDKVYPFNEHTVPGIRSGSIKARSMLLSQGVGSTNEPRSRIDSASIGNGGLDIDCTDGHQSQHHPMWLRHRRECSDRGSSLDGVRGNRIHHMAD
jgi:hypothetical protein